MFAVSNDLWTISFPTNRNRSIVSLVMADVRNIIIKLHYWVYIYVVFPICSRLFEQYPDTKGAFSVFKSMGPEDKKYEQELRAHGARVMRTVGEVIDRIHDHDAIVTHIHDLGSRHLTFNAKPDFIDVSRVT